MQKILQLHPDDLYECPYEEHVLETDEYQKPELKFKGDYKYENGVVIVTWKGFKIVLENCFENTIRLRLTQPGRAMEKTVTERLGLIETNWTEKGYDYKVENDVVYFANKRVALEFDLSTNDFTFKTIDGKILTKTKNGGVKFAATAEYSGMRSYTEFERVEEEKYAGFGARMYQLDRTGTSCDVFSEKGGVLIGDYGGFPMPYFLSSRGYGFFFNNPWPHVYFDMAKTKPDEWFLNAPGGDYDIFLFVGSAPEITRSFTAIAGRNQVPRKWNIGYWCSSLAFLYREEVTDAMHRMRAEDYPCDAIVLDGPWRGGKDFATSYSMGWGYPSDDYNWHPDFGDGPAMVKELMKDDIKTVLHINSCAFCPETAVDGIARGLLRQVGSETVPDVATKEGLEYYKTFIVPRIKEGVHQWWTDHSDRVSGEILPGIPSRNTFGALWNKAITENLEENGVKGHMSLSRGGGIGSQRYATPWSGDTQFGIDRFIQDIQYIINAGMAGFTLSGYDLGGFCQGFVKDITADEMQFDLDNIARRFCQSLIFCPMPRMHNRNQCLPKWPWNCPEEAQALYHDCLKFRYRFAATMYSYAINGALTGEPIVRPMYYYDLANTDLYAMENQFYIGDHIICAPVTEPKATSREVYLPSGKWVNMWTKEVVEGDKTIVCDTPLLEKEGLPMFVKVGGGIVYQPDCLSLKDEIPNELRIELYADDSAEVKLYESETVCNKFSCKKANGGFEIYVENNSDIDRKYVVVIYADGKEIETVIDVKANAVKTVNA